MVADSDQTDISRMIALPSLHTFSIGRIIPPRYLPTEFVNRVMTWLLSAMKNVETFSFGHGEHEGFTYVTLPGMGENGIPNFPSTLRKLHLRDINIESSALASSNIDIESIESIVLENCGANQIDALQNFCRAYQGRGDGTTATPSLGVSGNTAFMVRGAVSFPSDAIEMDALRGIIPG